MYCPETGSAYPVEFERRKTWKDHWAHNSSTLFKSMDHRKETVDDLAVAAHMNVERLWMILDGKTTPTDAEALLLALHSRLNLEHGKLD